MSLDIPSVRALCDGALRDVAEDALHWADELGNNSREAQLARGVVAALDEIEALRKALGEIADDPHQAYPASSMPAQRQYDIGAADGHRCAARAARIALGRPVE